MAIPADELKQKIEGERKARLLELEQRIDGELETYMREKKWPFKLPRSEFPDGEAIDEFLVKYTKAKYDVIKDNDYFVIRGPG